MVGTLRSRAVSALLTVAALALAGCGADDASVPEGHWGGVAVLPGDTIEISLSIHSLPRDPQNPHVSDSLVATISAPALMVLDQPLTDVSWVPPRLSFVASRDEMPLTFDARRSGRSLRGAIRFDGLPRAFGAAPVASFDLTQDRVPPRAPYVEEPVDFPGDSITLSGACLVPRTTGRLPAVVLLHGSSDGSRESMRAYGDAFARAGIVALIYDRRGTGGSTGDAPSASYADLAEDGTAAARYLAGRPDVDSNRVAVCGLSQGAWLAPRVARDAPISTVLAISAPGLSLGAIAAYQDSVRVRLAGFDEPEAGEAARLDRALARHLLTPDPGDSLEARLAAARRTEWGSVTALPARVPDEDQRRGWYWGGRNDDVLAAWRDTRVPVHLVYGEDDRNLPARPSDSLITRALLAAGNRQVSSWIVPGANHAIKRASAPGEPMVWPRFDPAVTDSMVVWIRTAQRPPPELRRSVPHRRAASHRRRHR